MEEQKQPHWWGVSLAFDLKSCRQDFITNPEKLKLWIKDLVEEIEMEAYGDPQIVHFGEPGSNKEGWTVCQLITTSCITLHANDHTGDCYLDVFTCKLVENLEYRIEQHCFEWFECKSLSYEKIYRLA